MYLRYVPLLVILHLGWRLMATAADAYRSLLEYVAYGSVRAIWIYRLVGTQEEKKRYPTMRFDKSLDIATAKHLAKVYSRPAIPWYMTARHDGGKFMFFFLYFSLYFKKLIINSLVNLSQSLDDIWKGQTVTFRGVSPFLSVPVMSQFRPYPTGFLTLWVATSASPATATWSSQSRSGSALKVTGFRVPSLALYGSDVELDCPFTAPVRMKLYSVKWYHNSGKPSMWLFLAFVPN